jgi:hypothetical protein
MAVPGFDDPALASLPAGGNLYFAQDQALMVKDPGEVSPSGYPTAQGTSGAATNLQLSPLMFGSGKMTGEGEAIVTPEAQSKGHFSEILNFHGSPAPWILIGLLLAAGLLMFQAKVSVNGAARL